MVLGHFLQKILVVAVDAGQFGGQCLRGLVAATRDLTAEALLKIAQHQSHNIID